MALFEWDERFSVRIPSIDAQHQRLVGILNKLHEAMQNGKGREVLASILVDLIAYTQTHFALEEGYFRTHGYPDAAAHEAEHRALAERTLKLQSEFNAGKAAISNDVLLFLTDWWQHHIRESDKAYSAFLVERGVK